LLVHFSYLLCELAEVQEVDINPLLANPEGLLALDARVLLVPPTCDVAASPRLTIEPYPNQDRSVASCLTVRQW
jgi:acetyltransferase